MTAQERSSVRSLVERGQSLSELGWTIIDAHAHMGPTGEFYIPSPGAASMVELMDRVGVNMTGISTHLAITNDHVRGNNLTHQAVKGFPGRFFGYVTVNPRYDDMVSELHRGYEELGLLGIKLHPSVHDYALTEPACEPIWHFAEQRQAFILIHTWGGDRRCDPAVVAKVAQQHPQIRFLLGHSGGTTAGRRTAIQVAAEQTNLYLELCSSWAASQDLEDLVNQADLRRVIYGTDTPWLDPRFMLGKIAYTSLADEQLRMILGENMREVADLP